MASNIEATKKGYEAFQRGDIPSLMKDLLHDELYLDRPRSQGQATLGSHL